MITAKEALAKIRKMEEERERKRLEAKREAEEKARQGESLELMERLIETRIQEGHTFAHIYGHLSHEAYVKLKEAGYVIYRAQFSRTDVCSRLEEYTDYSFWTGKSTKKTRIVREPVKTDYYLTVVSWDVNDMRLKDFLRPTSYGEI